MSIPLISPKQLQLQQGSATTAQTLPPVLIDVRTPMEFQGIHATGARNIPLDRLDPQQLIADLNGNHGDTIYFICRSGMRASKACQQMIASGYNDVCSVEGGTMAWESSGLPVVRGKSIMSLERQVRIATGSLAGLGGLLAIAVHPYWGILPAAVGSGLVFSGITDSCAMGMLLSKMPWNQMPSDIPETCCASPT